MNIVFAGTPAFAVPSLEALVAAGHRILAVYTQPDRPAGRGRKLAESAVKQCALRHGLAIRQPASLRDTEAQQALRALAPNIMIVIAYGLILPEPVLAIPARGCLNVHASLLPRWRGAAPIARAIEAGDRESGVTIMQMEAGLDTGPMLLKRATPIADTDTAASLHDRLATLGAQALVEALAALEAGGLVAEPQDPAAACYAKKLSKEEALIDWRESAAVLHRKVRAFNPWPVAHTLWRGESLRLWEVGPLADRIEARAAGQGGPACGFEARATDAAPGTVIAADGGVRIATSTGTLTVTRLQRSNGKPLAAVDFVNGTHIAAGERLG